MPSKRYQLPCLVLSVFLHAAFFKFYLLPAQQSLHAIAVKEIIIAQTAPASGPTDPRLTQSDTVSSNTEQTTMPRP